MMPPPGERFVRPAEELDFRLRTGEIAEDDFAPREPKHHRQSGANRERQDGRLRRAQFSGPEQLPRFA